MESDEDKSLALQVDQIFAPAIFDLRIDLAMEALSKLLANETPEGLTESSSVRTQTEDKQDE